MITESDFGTLMSNAEDGIKELALEFMTNYDSGDIQFEPRDDFTRRVLRMLEIITGNIFNRSGSFMPMGAEDAFNDETRTVTNNFGLIIRVYHRLRELEKGDVNFRWLVKSWHAYRKILYARGHRRLAAEISADLKAGAHNINAPPRPYIGAAVAGHAPVLAEEINKLLLSSLPIRRV